VWGIEEAEGLYYGFPIRADYPGLRVALHAKGPVIDPDTADRGDISADLRMLERFIAGRMPKASGPLLSAKTCLYTNSPDHHFIVGRHPNRKNVTIAAGFSGHGFKFATAIGEVLADLALDGATRLPIEFLSPRRFREGK
jgi:sarcosine oxidase